MMWLEKATMQGDPDAVGSLTFELLDKEYETSLVKSQAMWLWREAVQLGYSDSLYRRPERFYPKDPLRQFMWVRRVAIQGNWRAWRKLANLAMEELCKYREGATGRLLFEIGMTLTFSDLWHTGVTVDTFEQTVKLYEQWCSEAERGALCWFWLASALGVAKDIRVLIAVLVWEREHYERSWESTRGTNIGCGVTVIAIVGLPL